LNPVDGHLTIAVTPNFEMFNEISLIKTAKYTDADGKDIYIFSDTVEVI
jgi:hypothetical protein